MTAPLSREAKAALKEVEDNAKALSNKMFGAMYYQAAYNRIVHGDVHLWKFIGALEHMPVDIETFMDSEEFFGATDLVIWPAVREAVFNINRSWWKGKKGGAYDQGILMGATSTAKTTVAIISTAYHAHILLCMQNPQTYWGLPSATSIVFAILAAKPNVMRKVVYIPLRKHIEAMPWFQAHGLPDRQLDSEMDFKEKNIRIIPAGGDEDAILGEAIVGGIVDEINFMDVVLRSKKAEVTTGRPGVYDRAEQVFTTMLRRKSSRFARGGGPSIGVCFASSSTRYRGDYTDKRKALVDKGKIANCYVYNKKRYDVWPPETYSGVRFRLVVANEYHHDTRILEPNENVPEGSHVENVPIEFKEDFESNVYDALRDVIGISSNALSPFIKMRFKVHECFEYGTEVGLESFLLKDHVVLGVDGMPMVKDGHYCQNPSLPRFVHIDLSRNADRCGIAMVCFTGVTQRQREKGTEIMPTCKVEMACTIEPDANHEIQVADIRAFVSHLKTKYGYPIKAVTYDNVDSRESIQAWKAGGMKSKQFSVDRTAIPYKQFRDAMYDRRIAFYDNDILLDEIVNLEYDEPKDKVDHPVNGSKDCADAVCAAYSMMLERKATWHAAAADDMYRQMQDRASFDERFDAPRR